MAMKDVLDQLALTLARLPVVEPALTRRRTTVKTVLVERV
jgi:hypothetical protein